MKHKCLAKIRPPCLRHPPNRGEKRGVILMDYTNFAPFLIPVIINKYNVLVSLREIISAVIPGFQSNIKRRPGDAPLGNYCGNIFIRRHIKSRIIKRDTFRSDTFTERAVNFFGVPLFYRDVSAGLQRKIETGQSRRYIERHIVHPGTERQSIGPDFVCGITVGSNPVRSDNYMIYSALTENHCGHIVTDYSHRHAAF